MDLLLRIGRKNWINLTYFQKKKKKKKKKKIKKKKNFEINLGRVEKCKYLQKFLIFRSDGI